MLHPPKKTHLELSFCRIKVETSQYQMFMVHDALRLELSRLTGYIVWIITTCFVGPSTTDYYWKEGQPKVQFFKKSEQISIIPKPLQGIWGRFPYFPPPPFEVTTKGKKGRKIAQKNGAMLSSSAWTLLLSLAPGHHSSKENHQPGRAFFDQKKTEPNKERYQKNHSKTTKNWTKSKKNKKRCTYDINHDSKNPWISAIFLEKKREIPKDFEPSPISVRCCLRGL